MDIEGHTATAAVNVHNEQTKNTKSDTRQKSHYEKAHPNLFWFGLFYKKMEK